MSARHTFAISPEVQAVLARAWSALEAAEVKRGGNSDRKAMRANLRALGEAS